MRAARTDSNQQSVIDALRQAGCIVEDTHRQGGGYPDLTACDPSGYVWLIEVKAPGGRLNARELAWHQDWLRCTRLIVVHSAEDALEQMGLTDSFWQETLHATPKEG